MLFLERAPGHPGSYRLTEFGMSKFDLVSDGEGRRFALRPAFGPREDLLAAGRADIARDLAAKAPIPARDAASFLSALRALAQGAEPGEILWRQMRRPENPPSRHPKWINIGGREPGDCGDAPCLWRWFWDSGSSSNGVVEVRGTQTNLTGDDAAGCGMDSICDVRHAVDQWKGVAQTDVRLSGPTATGNIEVGLDAVRSFDGGATWSTPGECGGVIGLGGPGFGTGPRSYRGDATYYAPSSGEVSMRKMTCSTGYSARTFKSAVMHELGHVLGLGHPDNFASVHSTTSDLDHDRAVMHSSIPESNPETLQADDIQAIQYLYTTGSFGPIPVADFEVFQTPPVAHATTQFGDLSSNAPTSWRWDFGDPSSGQDNVSASDDAGHAFSRAGSFLVTLSASNANGTGTISRSITVADGPPLCQETETTMCLNDGRFEVTAGWSTDDRQGTAGRVTLTDDSGYFWFFDPANAEVVVKVLSACTLNPPRYWVFAAGLTNVGVNLKVFDTASREVRIYSNPLGRPFAPVQDTSAFTTCP